MSVTNYIFRLYFEHAWRYKKLVIALLIWHPILIVLHQIIPPLIAANVLDRLSSGDYIKGEIWSSFGNDLLLYTLLIVFTSTIGWRIIIYIIWTVEAKVSRDLMRRIFSHFTALDMDFHNNSFGGSLVSRSNKLVGSYIRVADTFVFEIYGLITMFIATGIVLWSRVPYYVVIFYVFSAIYMFIAIKITKRIRELSSIEASKQNVVTGYLADMLTNVLAVKSFARKNFENTRFARATKSLENATHKLKWSQIHRENVFGVSTSTITSIALVMAVVSVLVYDAQIGTVFLVYTYTTNLTVRLWDFSQRTLRNLNKAIGDAEEGAQNLMRKPEIVDPVNPLHMPPNDGSISFEQMTFSHDKNKLFENFTFHIAKGERIGLVGHSGSGKSTLTKLLLRFKDVQAGSIKINGVDIRQVKQDDLRQVISYVPQEPLLFHRSLRENIAYGKENPTDEEVIRASKNAHAHEFITTLEHGYDTLVGERGVKLSGGQKQRVAIARAMVKDAPILLLDEATSALDSESEAAIQDALWKLMEGKTSIVIAHRLSTIQRMDRILVLDEGTIVEQGTHKELLKKKNGQYARLWKHQSGGFLQD